VYAASGERFPTASVKLFAARTGFRVPEVEQLVTVTLMVVPLTQAIAIEQPVAVPTFVKSAAVSEFVQSSLMVML
jgi:hypothetical protein